MKINIKSKIIRNFLKIISILLIISFFAIKLNMSPKENKKTTNNFNFKNICKTKRSKNYNKDLCKNINKKAYSAKYMNANQNFTYGPIIGVSWLNKGDNQNHHGKKYYIPSEKESYYYIIGSNKSDYKFLINVSEVETK